jgi:hypothetical protein
VGIACSAAFLHLLIEKKERSKFREFNFDRRGVAGGFFFYLAVLAWQQLPHLRRGTRHLPLQTAMADKQHAMKEN